MSGEACPLPTPPRGTAERDVVRRLLDARRIAVVGLSDDPSRPSHGVAAYLKSIGREILPVNPAHETILGVPCYPTLADVPGPIDLVNVFRRPEHCPAIVHEAIAAGAKGIWLQSGIVSPESLQLSEAAGLDYVENRCLMVEVMRK